MTTTAIILTMPAGAKADPEALRREFGAQGVDYNWHPSQDARDGVLHLTCMHPEDLRAAGCTNFIERGWAKKNQAQAGRIALPLEWLLAILLVALMAGAQLLTGPTDHEAAQDTASETTGAPITAAEQLRRDLVLERLARSKASP